MLISYPLASLTIGEDVLTFYTGPLAIFDRAKWSVHRDQITNIQPTDFGVRFFAEGFEYPWVTGSITTRRFLAKLREHGIVPQGPVIPSTWYSI